MRRYSARAVPLATWYSMPLSRRNAMNNQHLNVKKTYQALTINVASCPIPSCRNSKLCPVKERPRLHEEPKLPCGPPQTSVPARREQREAYKTDASQEKRYDRDYQRRVWKLSSIVTSWVYVVHFQWVLKTVVRVLGFCSLRQAFVKALRCIWIAVHV